MTTLIFVPPGHDLVELARAEVNGGIPCPGDEGYISMAALKDRELVQEFQPSPDSLFFRVVSVSWDLKNTLVTEPWIRIAHYEKEPSSFVYVRIEPLDEETRGYIERRIETEKENE